MGRGRNRREQREESGARGCKFSRRGVRSGRPAARIARDARAVSTPLTCRRLSCSYLAGAYGGRHPTQEHQAASHRERTAPAALERYSAWVAAGGLSTRRSAAGVALECARGLPRGLFVPGAGISRDSGKVLTPLRSEGEEEGRMGSGWVVLWALSSGRLAAGRRITRSVASSRETSRTR